MDERANAKRPLEETAELGADFYRRLLGVPLCECSCTVKYHKKIMSN